MLTTVRVPPRPVAVGRILLGLGLLATAIEGAALLARLQDDRLLTPTVPGLLDADQVPVAVVLLASVLGATAVTTGILVRTGLLTCAAVDVLLMLTDLQLGSNHRVLAVLLCLAMLGARSDRALAPGASARRAREPDVPWWPQLLALGSVSSCYLFAGLSKANPVFLDGAELDAMRWVRLPETLVTPFAALVVLTEVGIAVGLWLRRTRVLAVVAGLGLHVSIVVLLPGSFVFAEFALLCWSVYPLALTQPALAQRGRSPAPAST